MLPPSSTSASISTSISAGKVLVPRRRRYAILAIELIVMGVLPVLLALRVFSLFHWDLSVPLAYNGSDDDWQLVLTKMVRDTGWFLTSPYMGAPDIAHWNYHSAAQTSSLHSIIMRVMSWFINDAVRIQQTYYLLNFALISLSSYAACRMLGLARFASGSIGYLFAFTSLRLGWAFYAFLSNYAAVPLAFVPVIWILTGEYAAVSAGGMGALLRSRKFWAGLLFLILVTLSDGYYAFFTLLMLGFATVVRCGLGDLRQPVRLLAPVLFLGALMAVALGMTIPLKSYEKAHLDEFFIDGKLDSTLSKHNYEAEVYSSSLKLMIAPQVSHRIPILANLGKMMVDSSDQARKFPTIRPIASLGSICSLLLLVGIIAGPIMLLRRPANRQVPAPPFSTNFNVALAAGALGYFIFLCSISGGIGSLVALVYPTIRAYERFPLFLAFALLVGTGSLVSAWVSGAARPRWLLAYGAAAVLAMVGVLDQTPNDLNRGDPVVAKRFLAERKLVHEIERQLPAGSMVYQYPHSQYLHDNPYYGWGSFAHLRLYLHSEKLRWSNGASKNSPVETWHDRTAAMPTNRLLDEIAAVGFHAMVIDRTVMKVSQYQQLKEELIERGLQVQEDSASNLAWLRLPDTGYRVVYDARFDNIDRITIRNPATFSGKHLPLMIHGNALRVALTSVPVSGNEATIIRSVTPAVFLPAPSNRGMGARPVIPLTDLAGALRCTMAPGTTAQALVTIDNQSGFDWKFGSGSVPLKMGVHIRGADNAMLRFDDGYRIKPGMWLVPAHDSVAFTVPLADISHTGLPAADGMFAEFGILQEGHAWFDQLSCQLPLPASK
jgi:hypothetical protein